MMFLTQSFIGRNKRLKASAIALSLCNFSSLTLASSVSTIDDTLTFLEKYDLSQKKLNAVEHADEFIDYEAVPITEVVDFTVVRNSFKNLKGHGLRHIINGLKKKKVSEEDISKFIRICSQNRFNHVKLAKDLSLQKDSIVLNSFISNLPFLKKLMTVLQSEQPYENAVTYAAKMGIIENLPTGKVTFPFNTQPVRFLKELPSDFVGSVDPQSLAVERSFVTVKEHLDKLFKPLFKEDLSALKVMDSEYFSYEMIRMWGGKLSNRWLDYMEQDLGLDLSKSLFVVHVKSGKQDAQKIHIDNLHLYRKDEFDLISKRKLLSVCMNCSQDETTNFLNIPNLQIDYNVLSGEDDFEEAFNANRRLIEAATYTYPLKELSKKIDHLFQEFSKKVHINDENKFEDFWMEVCNVFIKDTRVIVDPVFRTS